MLVNVAGMVLLPAAVRRATHDERAGWMAIAIATIAVLNGMVHLMGTLVTGRYSPGLISGVVLYLPLGALALLRAAYQADPGTMSPGIWAGVAVHLGVFATAFLLSRA